MPVIKWFDTVLSTFKNVSRVEIFQMKYKTYFLENHNPIEEIQPLQKNYLKWNLFKYL